MKTLIESDKYEAISFGIKFQNTNIDLKITKILFLYLQLSWQKNFLKQRIKTIKINKLHIKIIEFNKMLEKYFFLN